MLLTVCGQYPVNDWILSLCVVWLQSAIDCLTAALRRGQQHSVRPGRAGAGWLPEPRYRSSHDQLSCESGHEVVARRASLSRKQRADKQARSSTDWVQRITGQNWRTVRREQWINKGSKEWSGRDGEWFVNKLAAAFRRTSVTTSTWRQYMYQQSAITNTLYNIIIIIMHPTGLASSVFYQWTRNDVIGGHLLASAGVTVKYGMRT